MFYAGAPVVVKMRMFRNYDFDAAEAMVDQALAGYGADDYSLSEDQVASA
jgi:hypothetical protein